MAKQTSKNIVIRKSKILLIALIMFRFSSQNLFATNIPAGNVYGHWIQAGSPYLVLGNITIPQDSLLQIDDGVVVEFQGHYQLHVLGRILALGTAGNLITFTALSNWWGIRYDAILSAQDSSLFMYCKFEKGNANGTGNYQLGGAFFIPYFSKIRVENCTISNNSAYYGGAFYCDHANPKIIGNTFSNNTATGSYGGGIYCWYSSPVIANNIMTYNVSSICCKYSSPVIRGNSVTYTTANPAIYCEYSSPSIINNIISHNPMGIYIDNSSPNVIGNVITYNTSAGTDYGAGIRCRFNSFPQIINNTIANNTALIYGGGLYTDFNSSPLVKNTILWGNYVPNNQGTQLALDQTSFPTFYNCDIQGGSAAFYYYDAPNTFTGTYINNIDSDPIFINASGNNFSLQATSLCINAGDTTGITLPLTDLAGSPRVCNNDVEIGAYEICATGIQDFSLSKLRTIFYPNPSDENVTLEISRDNLPKNLKLQLTNVLGEYAKQIIVQDSKTTISLHEMTSGIYFYQLSDDKDILSTGKIIVE